MKMATLQFCLPVFLGIHRNPKQKSFLNSFEGFVKYIQFIHLNKHLDGAWDTSQNGTFIALHMKAFGSKKFKCREQVISENLLVAISKYLVCRQTSISWRKCWIKNIFLICFFPESDWRPCESILGAISKCLLSRQTSFHEKNERMLEFTLSPNDHDPKVS